MIITLPQNQKRVTDANEYFAKRAETSPEERLAARKEVLATEQASGDGDFTRIKQTEGKFIDLAIHKDSFAMDLANMTDLDVGDVVVWKTKYAPTVGVTTGSVYNAPTQTLYANRENYASLTPFVYEAEDVRVPAYALTQDIEKLGLREDALMRQAESLKLSLEKFVVNIMMSQPLGTDLATSVTNYFAAGNSYSGKSVYVADPGVQSGTYEASNLIDVHNEAGLTPTVAEAISVQDLLSKRNSRTIHIPVQGLPWRKLMRFATIVSDQGSGIPNTGLRSIPASAWEDVWGAKFNDGVVLNWFGSTFKFKANNVLPQGYGIVTTDQPAAQVFNINSWASTGEFQDDPKDKFFSTHWAKREIAICTPDPWLRNFYVINFGNTSGL